MNVVTYSEFNCSAGLKYTRDEEGNVVYIEMDARSAVRLGWMWADRSKLPAHRPLREAIIRVQDAYRAELAERVRQEDAEFRNAGRSGGGGREESAGELRARLAAFDQAAADRKKRSRGNR